MHLEQPQNVALIGATGFVGRAVLRELLDRGHLVTALSRKLAGLVEGPRLQLARLDAYAATDVANAIRGHHAVISTFNPGWGELELYARFMRGADAIMRGVEAAGVQRLLVVGGAGSLLVAPGVQLVDTPDFVKQVPSSVVPGARAARDTLAALRNHTKLEWTFLSPPAFLEPGPRSGDYRLGGSELLMEGEQPARISVADLAVALVDELERPRHVRAQFTVARASVAQAGHR